jgi:hypothetical protein
LPTAAGVFLVVAACFSGGFAVGVFFFLFQPLYKIVRKKNGRRMGIKFFFGKEGKTKIMVADFLSLPIK